MNKQNKFDVLKKYFGYDEFRLGQAEIIDAQINGQDVLGVMPTGAGKSICYQIPAVLLDGVAVVISPLISLMRDQVMSLAQIGIEAAFINSSLSGFEIDAIMQDAMQYRYKIIYIAPERLLMSSTISLFSRIKISLVAVDEAHCISQWGQDFRPSYLDIPKFINSFSVRPIVCAFTATATPQVREDIVRALDLRNPFTLVSRFDRPNLYFEVVSPINKYSYLDTYLKANDEVGIIYCSTRKEVEKVTEYLNENGFSAARYHAGLSDEERSRAQDDFLYDRVKIIVATNAFGMGIDKSNVRFVLHFNMPQNVESYYQEAGRAGRDGLPSDCILLYSRKDISTAMFLINKSENPDDAARNRKLLNKMEQYCESDGCLRQFMLNYFGEQTDQSSGGCDNCSNCKGTASDIPMTDVTINSQKILSHIARLNDKGKRFMFTHTADILLGKSDDFKDLSTYGIMKDSSRKYIRQLTTRLATLGYIHDDGYLSVTPLARDVLFGKAKVIIRSDKLQKTHDYKQNNYGHKIERAKYNFSDELFTKLKALRMEIANESKVPAFTIFHDSSLVDMCQKHPQTKEEFLEVSGVGNVKFDRYGERFLEVLKTNLPAERQVDDAQNLTKDMFLSQVEFSDDAISISRVADIFNAVLMRYNLPKVSAQGLNKLLINEGLLSDVDGKKLPTSTGEKRGIETVTRTHDNGDTYTMCLFNEEAQLVCAGLIDLSEN